MNEETFDKASIIKQYMSEIAKSGHKKSPRGKEFYSRIGSLGGRPKGYSPKK